MIKYRILSSGARGNAWRRKKNLYVGVFPGVDPASTASEVCLMMSEVLNLLNNCSPVGDVLPEKLGGGLEPTSQNP